MKYYKLLKLNSLIKSNRIKLLGLYFLHVFKRRYLAVHFDPVNACNLRCKMCYFTDKDYVKKLKGVFSVDDLPSLGRAVLNRAVKFQIGCGTEPTLYKDLNKVIQLGKEYNIPYISMTTNANLIEKNQLLDWCESGLNEITVSLHGTVKETYEEMMGRGNFEKFLQSLRYISEIKEQFPDFQLRVNYTFNEDNFDELAQFWSIFDGIKVDVLQIRPIRKLGNTAYDNFSVEKIIPNYKNVYSILKRECELRGTLFIAPNINQLQEEVSSSSIVHDFTYYYIGPTSFGKEDFDWKNETYDEYSNRTGWKSDILNLVFSSNKKLKTYLNNKLNYDIS
jgi:molybdenum cofactor biosynthesis enzyme MoaA